MRLQTLAAVTHPSLAEIANCTDHPEAGSESTSVSDYAISALQHAFDLAAMCADWKFLNVLAEITKCPGFLLLTALVAFLYVGEIE